MYNHVGICLFERRHPAREAFQLLVEEGILQLIGGREVSHQPDQLKTGCSRGSLSNTRGRLRVTRAEAAHATVELDVHTCLQLHHRGELRYMRDVLLAPNDDVKAMNDCLLQILRADWTQQEQWRLEVFKLTACHQIACFHHACHGQPRGTAG